MASDIVAAENGFNDYMKQADIKLIEHDDTELREKSWNVVAFGAKRHGIHPTHFWAQTLHLHHDRPKVGWDHPCTRCELVNKAMYGWEPAGFKAVDWMEEYPPLNCAECFTMTSAIYDDNGRIEAGDLLS